MNPENPETIFVQTDPAFNIVLQSLRELTNQNRLQVTHVQAATLKNIESNVADVAWWFMFGEESESPTNSAFGLTASAVVRMCMLEAAGVARTSWPNVRLHTLSRNEAKLQNPLTDENNQPLARNFHLANTRDTARRYLSKYGHIYPPFRIEDKISQVPVDKEVSMPSMMLIIRGDFKEVVEITTTFTFTPRREQQFDSFIHVNCIVREIVGKESKDDEFTRKLKELMVPGEIEGEYFEKLRKVVSKTGFPPAWQLPDAFAKLKVEDKNV